MLPMNRRFNIAVNHIASILFPAGFDISPSAPSSINGLCESFTSGRLTVYDGASDKTIFACTETNYNFRAWHDHCHVRPSRNKLGRYYPSLCYQFTESGESSVCLEQYKDIESLYGNGRESSIFKRIIHAEIMGQWQYKESLGGFPIDQYGFVAMYLQDSLRAMNTNFGISRPHTMESSS